MTQTSLDARHQRRRVRVISVLTAGAFVAVLAITGCADGDPAVADVASDSGTEDLRLLVSLSDDESAAETTEKLPAWAWLLVATVGIMALIGLVYGLLSRDDDEAKKRALWESQRPQWESQQLPTPAPPASGAAIAPPPAPPSGVDPTNPGQI